MSTTKDLLIDEYNKACMITFDFGDRLRAVVASREDHRYLAAIRDGIDEFIHARSFIDLCKRYLFDAMPGDDLADHERGMAAIGRWVNELGCRVVTEESALARNHRVASTIRAREITAGFVACARARKVIQDGIRRVREMPPKGES